MTSSSSSTKTHRMECKQLYVKICVEYSFYLPANWSSEYDAWKTNPAMLANDILMFKWFIVITILMQLYLDICQLECELCSEYWTRRDFDVRTDAILCCSSFLMFFLSSSVRHLYSSTKTTWPRTRISDNCWIK